ncbi:hypothetical protein [Geoglobus acetivorans]|uniref:Ribbon-helix-helix protein CopG domain-containing protein n=1 Tax=Geoglobus acetivorans TaxID=565033 RepID=A0ABZ3H3X7_GEOAI|nr:hypothetical protein [Geoglobus acetivorans]
MLCNEGCNESNNLPRAGRRLQVVITEAEYEAFKEALKRSGRYHSMSDALRDFIRDFVDAHGVTPRSAGVGKETPGNVVEEVNSDA